MSIYGEGGVNIKSIKLILFVLILLLIGSCSENFSNNKDDIEIFSTQEEALDHFIDNENIEGNIELVTTTNNELLLVVERSKNIYFVGELKEDDKGMFALKISADVNMDESAGGGAWELVTLDGNEYTIYFEKTNERPYPYLINLSNDEYFVSIVEGHTLSENSLGLTNVIKEVDIIKSN